MTESACRGLTFHRERPTCPQIRLRRRWDECLGETQVLPATKGERGGGAGRELLTWIRWIRFLGSHPAPTFQSNSANISKAAFRARKGSSRTMVPICCFLGPEFLVPPNNVNVQSDRSYTQQVGQMSKALSSWKFPEEAASTVPCPSSSETA